MPSLNDARARIGRARDHITRLEREIAAVLPPDRTITTPIMGPAFVSGGTEYINAPPILAILIGETLYNLRGALDYLVYELFYLDTGGIENGTKFLIEDSIASWNNHLSSPGTAGRRRRKLWLYRLTMAHKTALQALQPCYGCTWTARLRDLSNPDKHRRLTTIVASVNHGGHGAIGFGPVMVTTHLTTKVAFEDGSFVVETLKLLQKEVADVIEAFDPDF